MKPVSLSLNSIVRLRLIVTLIALALSAVFLKGGIFTDIPGLSSDAQNSLVAHYDGRTGVVTGTSNDVVSWTPVAGNGVALPSMIVNQTGSGPDIITYNGSNTLFSSSSSGTTSRQLQGNLVAGASTAYAVFWTGRHLTPAPFEASGNYVYNIGGEVTHQRDVNSGVPAIELYDGSTTFRGADISAYDNVTTVWSTVYNDRTHRAYANSRNLSVSGTPTYSVGANPQILIGAFSTGGFNFNGEMEHLIIFNSTLSDSDRALIEGYLGVLRLWITSLGSEVRIEWPGWATNFILEASSNLSVTNWMQVTNVPVAIGDSLVVTNAISDNGRFYRLRQ